MLVTRPRAAFFLVVTLGALSAACENKVPEPTPEPPRPAAQREPEKPEPADLIKEDISVGTGPECKEGDKVKVHYTGRLLKTKYMFDSSTGKDPYELTIGAGEVIKGWDLGLPGMKVGGKRKLTIPSKLGYGETGSPPKIPGNATLVFDLELVAIVPKDAPADKKDEKKDAKKVEKKTDKPAK